MLGTMLPVQQNREHDMARRLFHQLRSILLVREGRNKRIAVILVAVVVFALVLLAEDWYHFPRWHPNLMPYHRSGTSQTTMHFPFRTGCPQDCRPYRARDENVDYDDLYRLTVEWYFGEPKAYNPNESWDSQRNSSSHSRGNNFECPESVVRTFQAAAADLKSAAGKLSTATRNISVHEQVRMHVSLSYICCLTMFEAQEALRVVDDWINQTMFDFTVRFSGEIVSWYESPNSVTLIANVDWWSQRTLMRLNHDLNRRLKASRIPMAVFRESQMPFHTTLAGFRYGDTGESYRSELEIASQLPRIYEVAQDVSNRYSARDWNGQGRGIPIQHKPRRSGKPSRHTHALVAHSSSRV
jgi:2'-5' RNA ligase